MSNQYKNQGEFFDKVGEHILHPKSYGDCVWPVSVEEMYQHFKQRLIEELTVGNDDSLFAAALYDTEKEIQALLYDVEKVVKAINEVEE